MKEQLPQKKKSYNYGIDLLRIIATMMIIGVHFLGNLQYAKYLPLSDNWFVLHSLSAICYSCVDIYAIISGYVKARNGVEKALSLWCCVVFYSLLSQFLSVGFHFDKFTVKNVVVSLLPFFSGRYWYFTAYIGLIVLQPFLSAYMEKLEFAETRKLLFIIIPFFCIFGWLGGVTGTGKWLGVYEGYSTLWLAIMYCLGYAIRKHGERILFHREIAVRKWAVGIIVCPIIIIITAVMIYFATNNLIGAQVGVHFFYSYLSPVVLIEAVCFFMLFEKQGVRISKSSKQLLKCIKSISSLTFGIYIAHTTPFFSYIWPSIVEQCELQKGNPVLLLLRIIIWSFIIFVVCGLGEMFRKKLFELSRLNRAILFISDKIKNIYFEFTAYTF